MSSERTPMPELAWRVARMCNSGECVQVAAQGQMIYIGDSKAPDGPVLSYYPNEWDQFVAGVKNGDFDDIK
jgi:hypothetical protein